MGPGFQACQAIHAAIEFALAFPALAVAAPAVVLLASGDELSLGWLREDAVAAGLRHTSFHEPDLNDALTALALEPAASRLVAGLPLALAGSRTSSGREEVRP
ncbi:MAG TPA: hypothetical protein VLM11_22590 [Streptosporangiaceae bacterium]|nr:hypothetical protein [Streptosporangiaceae bacterium]